MTVFIIWVICAVISGAIGSAKGRTGMGWGLGILLGPLGLLIVAVVPAEVKNVEAAAVQSGEGKKCPYCAEIVKAEAIVCKHCGRDLPAIQVSETPIENPAAIPVAQKIENWVCPDCATNNPLNKSICQNCGTRRTS
jgi:hypothetical protein